MLYHKNPNNWIPERTAFTHAEALGNKFDPVIKMVNPGLSFEKNGSTGVPKFQGYLPLGSTEEDF